MTITIKELLTEPGNVGKVLSLNREKLEKILILLTGREYGSLISLSLTAGLDQVGLMFKGSPLEILERYYTTQR